MYHPTRAASIIYACCILHNMALAANLPLQDDEIEYRDEANEFHRMGKYNCIVCISIHISLMSNFHLLQTKIKKKIYWK